MSDYTIAIQKDSPVFKLYQKLKADGVTDAELDIGYPETDYIKKTRKIIHQGDHIKDETEGLNYLLEHYERYQLEIKETFGHVVPWSLDDLNPATDFDAKIRTFVGQAVSAAKRILSGKGLKAGSARYNELLALSLFAFALTTKPKYGEKFVTVGMPTKILQELKKEGLDEIVNFLEGGGLAVSASQKDCELEASALEALAKGCGWCTEKSKIFYALLRTAGLKVRPLSVMLSRAFIRKKGLKQDSPLHQSVIVDLGGRKRIFDFSLGDLNAEPLYKKNKFVWWYEQTGAEFLASHLGALGEDHCRTGAVDRGMAELKTAVKLDPYSLQALNDLGNCYGRKGEPDRAIAELKKALKLDPNLAETHGNLGLVYAGKGEPDRAIAELQTALKLDPASALIHEALGNVYAQKGQPAQSLAEYKAALKINPNSAAAHTNLGIAYLLKGEPDRAVAELKAALKSEPKLAVPELAQVHYKLAAVYAQKGELDSSIAEMEKAIRLEPNFAEFYFNLGYCFMLKGIRYEKVNNRPEAAPLFQKALQQGRKAKALGYPVPEEYFTKLEELSKGTATPASLRSMEAELTAPARLPSPVDKYCHLGDEYYTKNELPKALVAYQQAVITDAKSAAALLGIWNTYKAMGNQELAKQACEQYKKVGRVKKLSCAQTE